MIPSAAKWRFFAHFLNLHKNEETAQDSLYAVLLLIKHSIDIRNNICGKSSEFGCGNSRMGLYLAGHRHSADPRRKSKVT